MSGGRPGGAGAMVAGVLAAMLLVTALVYWPGIGGPPVLDDLPQLSALLDDDGGRSAAGLHAHSSSGPLGRPVAMASFRMDAALSDAGLRAVKRTNVLVHLAAGGAVYLLAFLLLRAAGPVAGAGGARLAALAVAGLWLLHPLHVSTVLYAVQRMTELAALFSLLGLIAYCLGRERQLAGRPASGWMLACFGACWPLAVLSKETGLLLPLLAALVELFVYRGRHPAPRADRPAIAVAGAAAVLFAAGVLYAMWNLDTLVLAGYEFRDYSLGERVLTQFRVLMLYLGMLLVPVQARMGFVHDDLALSTGLLAPWTTLASLLAIAALVIAAVVLRRRAPLVGLGLALFLAGHLLESTVFPLEMMFEHRNYLPAFGVFLAVVGAAAHLSAAGRLKRAVAGACIVTLAFSTWVRVGTWSDEASLLRYMMRVHPESQRVTHVVARRLMDGGDFEAADSLLAARDTTAARLLRELGRCRAVGEARAAVLRAAAHGLPRAVDSLVTGPLMDLGRAGLQEQCRVPAGAYLALLEATLTHPIAGRYDRGKVMLYRAHYLHGQGRVPAALQALEEMVAEDAEQAPVALFLRTEWQIERGDLAAARADFARAVQAARESRYDFGSLHERVRARLARAQRAAR